MAQDTVNKAILVGGLGDRACVTKTLKLWGYKAKTKQSDPLAVYGSHASGLSKKGKLHKRLPYLESQVLFAIREEMAETVEDILSRRTRALLLDARAAIECAPLVARTLAKEKKKPASWEKRQLAAFLKLAKRYLP